MKSIPTLTSSQLKSPENKVLQAIKKLAVKYSWTLIRSLNLPIDERDDLEQEIHLALWLSLARFNVGRGEITAFLERVARNEMNDIIARRTAARRDYRRLIQLDGGPVGHQIATGLALDEKIIQRIDIARFIDTLPKRLHSVATALKNYSPTEVSRKLGVSRDTVHRQILELRARLVKLGQCHNPISWVAQQKI